MENTIKLTGLADTDKLILLHLHYDDLINLIKIDKIQRTLIYHLLPEIIKHNNTFSTRPIKFLVNLLELGEISFVKRILNTMKESHAVFTNLFDYIEPRLEENYIRSAPINYNWSHFMNHFLKMKSPPDLSDIIKINHFLEAAIDANKLVIVDLINDYWQNQELDDYIIILTKTKNQLLKMKSLLKID